jgi:hypothetical protein
MQDPDRRGRRARCAALIQGCRVHEWSWNAPSLFSKHQRAVAPGGRGWLRLPKAVVSVRHVSAPVAPLSSIFLLAFVGQFALQAQGQATQGRSLSTLAPLRVLRARTPVPAWARRAVGEGVKSCPRAGCGKSACPVPRRTSLPFFTTIRAMQHGPTPTRAQQLRSRLTRSVAVMVIAACRSWCFLEHLGSAGATSLVTRPKGRKVLKAHTTAAAVTSGPAEPERPEAA